MCCAPLGHCLATAAAIRDLVTPQGQFVLLVDCLQTGFAHCVSLPCSTSQFNVLQCTALNYERASLTARLSRYCCSFLGLPQDVSTDDAYIVRGWMNYFGRYNRSAMKKGLDCVQRRLIRWAMCKYKHFRRHRQRAEKWLNQIKMREPKMFAHWALS